MKVQKIRISALAIGILLVIMVLLSAIFTMDVPFIADAADVSTADYDKYTDSDTLLGSSYTIRDYAEILHHSTVIWDGINYSVTADDPIVQIVPKSLFSTKGEYLHIGKEYGFFVRTTADIRNPQIGSSKPDPYNNNVEVLIFDISTNTDIKNQLTPDLITVKIEPLFQYRYAYIDYRSNKFYSNSNKYSAQDFDLPYSIADGLTFVVPKPLSILANDFEQTWNYFLKNISVSSTLLNEQEQNEFDAGYMAANDDGYFFTQFDYKYDGFVSDVSTDNKISLGLNVASLVSGAVSLVPGPVGAVAGVLGLILSGVQTATSIAVTDKQGDPTAGVSVSNGAVTAENKFTTKEGQIDNYIHPVTKNPCLIKNATCMINGDDKHGNAWFRDGDHVTAYFRVSHTQDWHTRLEREIALSVVDKEGNTYNEHTVSQYKFMINEPNYSTVGLDEKTRLTILPDGDNYFKFSPLHTSDYQITFDNSQSAEVFVTSGSNVVATNKENGIISCRMTVGDTYQIRIHKKTAGDFNFTLSPPTAMPAIASKSEYLIKYVPANTGAYKLSVDNSGFLITKAYHNTPEKDYANLLGVTKGLNCKDFEAVLKKDNIYYLLLKNNTSASASSGIASTACSATWKAGANASKALVGGANYVYSKFIYSGKDSDVCFSFSGVDSADVNIQFYVFNQYGESVYINEQYYDGFMRLGQLSAGTYYIGVRAAKNVTVTPKVELKNVIGKWKQLINGKWTDIVLDENNEIVVYRGDTHYFGFWRGDTVFHYYKHSYNLSEKDNVSFDQYELKFTTTADAFDNVKTVLYTVLRSDSDYGNVLLQDGLAIRVMFNMKEINPVFSVDYANKIRISFKSGVIANNLKYSIRSNVSNGSAISDFITGTITDDDKIVDLEIMQKLCSRKATTAKFVLKSIEIESGLDNLSVRTIDINKVYDINCKEQRYDSANAISYISNELHLYNMRYNSAKNKILTNNINLKNFANWDIISVNPAGTTIDGKGYTISGMRFTVPTGSNKHYGFISENRGVVRSLYFTGVSITGKSSDKYGDMRFGAVAAVNYGKINYCKVSGIIDVYRRDGVVGGIVAINNKSAYVEDCVFGHVGNADQNYLGNSGDMGGIVGRNYGSIQFCRTLNATIGGDIDHCSNSYGGIAGYMEGGGIASCRTEGVHIKVTNSTLISGQYPSIGYIVGNMNSSSIMDSCIISNCSNYIKKLTVGYRKNCFNGTGGCYGVCVNSNVYRITVA